MNNPRAKIGFSHGRITSIGMYLSAPLVDDLSLPRATAPSDPHSSRESMETVGGIIIVLGCNATAAALCITLATSTTHCNWHPKTIIIVIGISSEILLGLCCLVSWAVDVLNPVTRSLLTCSASGCCTN